jgi:hypothetical protein
MAGVGMDSRLRENDSVVVQISIVIPAQAGIHLKHTRNVTHYFWDIPCCLAPL